MWRAALHAWREAQHPVARWQRIGDVVCTAASQHQPWWLRSKSSTSLHSTAAAPAGAPVALKVQREHVPDSTAEAGRSKRRKARGRHAQRPASPTAAAITQQQLSSSLTSALLQLQQLGLTPSAALSSASPTPSQSLLLRVAAQAHQQQHQQQQQRVHLEPIIRRPPPTTRARAHCIGLELDVARVKAHYAHALLHSATDFAVFSTHGLLQHANYYRTMHGHGIRPPGEQLHDQQQQQQQHTHHHHHHHHAGHEDEQVTRPMPLYECVVVYEFGAAVFFSSFAGAHDTHPAPPPLSAPHTAAPGGAGGAGDDERARGGTPVPASPLLDRQQQDGLEQLCLDALKQFVMKTPPEGTQLPPPEEVRLAVSSGIRKELQKGGELLQLKRWDQGSVEAVSRIMGQSVALDMHTDITDEKLYQLEQLMQQLAQDYRAPRHRRLLARIMALPPWLLSGRTPGSSSSTYINQEAQLVESSALTIMVINRLGILDKDHTPWESDQHDELWQRLRSFFTIDKRLSHLLRKLEQLEQKTDHLISLKTDERTMSVELLICGLIFTEIVINLQLGMHGHAVPTPAG